MEQRLKKEEEDRQARRKRVEAIMLRTRGKGGMSTTTPTKVKFFRIEIELGSSYHCVELSFMFLSVFKIMEIMH